MSDLLLKIKELSIEFQLEHGRHVAVDGIDLEIKQGQTVGVVGESGCGKSLTSLAIMQLLPAAAQISKGSILFNGVDLLSPGTDMTHYRGKKIAMIFQEPMTALNPSHRVGLQIAEVFQVHQKIGVKESLTKAIEMLDLVGIPEPSRRAHDYPHQLSGGMRQRVMIAMALACQPDLLIADEPTTALDVTIQAQILELMQDLQHKLGMGLLLITHDLGVVAQVCDEVAVMYSGKVIEKAPIQEIFEHPLHPYSKGLLESRVTLSTDCDAVLQTIPGSVPSLGQWPSGCRFANRCELQSQKCLEAWPKMQELAPQHSVSCYHSLSRGQPHVAI